MSKETEKIWTDKCKVLIGKTVKSVRYMTDEEMEKFGWYSKPLVIQFTDGTYLYSSADDEGNDGGALFTNLKGLDVIPVIR
jgi:hypothetical protein